MPARSLPCKNGHMHTAVDDVRACNAVVTLNSTVASAAAVVVLLSL